jgi:hypothetical protein
MLIYQWKMIQSGEPYLFLFNPSPEWILPSLVAEIVYIVKPHMVIYSHVGFDHFFVYFTNLKQLFEELPAAALSGW